MIIDSGFPPLTMTAIPDKRHNNKYYYDGYWRKWDLILKADLKDPKGKWLVQAVDFFGIPTHKPRYHSTDLWANRFADRPFDVYKKPIQTDWEWFQTLCPLSNLLNVDEAEQEKLFKAYLERRNYLSSYEALIRIGITNPVVFEDEQTLAKEPTPKEALAALFTKPRKTSNI